MLCPTPLANTNIPEQKTVICLAITPVNHSLLVKFSSWLKLIRITVRSLRWKQKQNRSSPRTTEEPMFPTTT